MKTILHFHTGRGGRFNNQGHVTFCGQATIGEVLSILDSGKHYTFYKRKNEVGIYNLLKKRRLYNLVELFEKCLDINDFSRFEKLTGLELGEDVHTDCDGVEVITAAEVMTGVGILDWDGEYDTDVCKALEDCNDDELLIVLDAGYECIIREYFDECTELNISWKNFNGDYRNLIYGYFNSGYYFDIFDVL